MRRIIVVFILFVFGAINGMHLISSVSGYRDVVDCVPYRNYAYLLAGRDLVVFDVSTPSSPRAVDTIRFMMNTVDMEIGYDTIGFLGLYGYIYFLNLSRPDSPDTIGKIVLPRPCYVEDLAFNNGCLFGALGTEFRIYGIGVTGHGIRDSLIFSYRFETRAVDAESIYAVIIGGPDTFGTYAILYDVTDPYTPVRILSNSFRGGCRDVDMWGNRIYGPFRSILPMPISGVALIDITSAGGSPYTYVTVSGDCNHGCAWDDFYVIANGSGGVEVVNWETMASPRLVDMYSSPGLPVYFNEINIRYPYIFASTTEGFYIFTSDSLPSIRDVSPPVVALVEPIPGRHSSCRRQRIVFKIDDPGGAVDWSSVIIEVNSIRYDSSGFTIRGDSAIFVPSSDLHDGDTVRFSLISASDTAGNAALGLPLSGYVVIDMSPPVVFAPNPDIGETVYTAFPVITAHIYDSLSNVDHFRVVVNDDTISLSSPDLTFEGDSFVYAPLIPVPRGSVTVCVIDLRDDVFYCGPNEAPPFCWWFYDSISSADITPPDVRLIKPLNGTATSDSMLPIEFYISDASGVYEPSIRLDVNGVIYNLSSSELTYSLDTLRFVPSAPYPEGENTVRLLSCSDLVGNASSVVSFFFKADYTAPTQLSMFPIPGAHLDYDTVTIDIFLIDPLNGTGIDTSDLLLYINDTLVTPSFNPVSDTLVHVLYFYDGRGYLGDTVRLSLRNLHDIIDYGSPNAAPTLEYWFTITHTKISESVKPSKCYLSVRPNPFNDKALVELALPKKECGELILYNLKGEVVKKLFEGVVEHVELPISTHDMESGIYILVWKGKVKNIYSLILVIK